MNKQIFLLSIVLFGLTSVKLIGQDSLSVKEFEYMTIVSEFPDNKLFLVYITKPDGAYEKLKYEKKGEFKYWQTTVILDLLNKHSESGWEVTNSNLTRENGIGYFYYLLKRKKE